MKIAWSKTRKQYPLSTKKILKRMIVDMTGWLILFIAVWGFLTLAIVFGNETSAWAPAALAISIVLALLILLIVFLYEQWYFAVYFYDFTLDYIVIKKGPITPREITIPYERVQDVYVDQDILDRLLGLYDVHLSSATISSGMEAHIDGVEKTASDGLRAILLQMVSERISKNKMSVPPQAQQQPIIN